jgi:hypothetical protein
VVGRVATVQDALRFVGAEVFDGPPVGDGEDATLLREPAAPVPGGRLRREHGVFLLRMTLTGSGPDGAPRPIVWPRDAAAVLPAELPWTAVELAPARAPLFAAPAPGTPPMRERHAIASRDGALYRLGTLDRCTGEGARMACLRWAQVVARDGDRFVGGYLPAHQVVDPRGWVRGRTRWPAVQAVHSGVRDGQAQILVRGHAPDGVPHQITLSAALVDGRLPRVELGLAGVDVRIDIEGQPSRRIVLDEALDRFPRE